MQAVHLVGVGLDPSCVAHCLSVYQYRTSLPQLLWTLVSSCVKTELIH